MMEKLRHVSFELADLKYETRLPTSGLYCTLAARKISDACDMINEAIDMTERTQRIDPSSPS